MPRLLCAHVPYPRLSEHLQYIIANRINPEVYLPADSLDQMIWEELSAQAEAIHAADLECTIHAPFMDLNPGALDASIREVTRRRFQQVFDVAECIRPQIIVFHPGYDTLRYGDNTLAWLKNSIGFWKEFIGRAEEIDCVMAVENIFEEEPSTLRALLEEVDHPRLRHCFDTGHWNMFHTVSLDQWFQELGSFIAECHIHDNNGKADEHLPPGEGNIDIGRCISLLRHFAPDAVWTLEAHTIERLERARAAISCYVQSAA